MTIDHEVSIRHQAVLLVRAETPRCLLRCEGCAAIEVAYNSCRNRHCPRCQASAARRWLEAREADLLPVEYYHVVFTLPAAISAIAYYNKAVIYGMLSDIAAETLRTIAADPKHLGHRSVPRSSCIRGAPRLRIIPMCMGSFPVVGCRRTEAGG